MISHHLAASLRHLARHRLYVALNVLGLAVGLAAALLVFLYVRHETSYDAFQPQVASTYRMGLVATDIQRESADTFTTTLAQQVVRGESGIEDLLALFPVGDPAGERVRVGDRQFRLTHHLAATPNLERFARVDVLAGELNAALTLPDQIAVSRDVATRIFGTVDVVGRQLTREHGAWTVAAVFEDLPANTHFDFEVLSSARRFLDGSPNFIAYTYVRLARGTAIDTLARRVSDEVTRRAPYAQRVSFHPLASIHLATGGRQGIVNICIALACVLIAIGALNFANMSTVQMSTRSREVGVRKALGASRARLVSQFLAEASLLALLAAVLAAAIAATALPWFDRLIDRPLTLSFFGGDGVILVATALVTGVIAGLYPALVMSSRAVASSLGRELDRGAATARVRKTLFVVQAAFSAALIVVVLAFWQQLAHLERLPTGYGKSARLEVHELDSEQLFATPDSALLNELARIDGVARVAAFDRSLTEGTGSTIDLIFPGTTHAPLAAGFTAASFGFVDAVGLDLLAGRDFSRDFTDWYRVDAGGIERASIVLTQSLARTAGFATPAAAIGQELRLGIHGSTRDFRVTIVGVVADVKVGSVREDHRQTFFICGFSWARTASVVLQAATTDVVRIRQDVTAVLRQQLGVANPDLRTIEVQYAAIYRGERGVMRIVASFCGLAIFLSVIGTFGLAAFSAQRREREFAVRRAHGASRVQLASLLINEYVILVLVSLPLAFPFAFAAITTWLRQFSERIDQSAALYIASGVLICGITAFTAASLALRAAAVRPAAALRHD